MVRKTMQTDDCGATTKLRGSGVLQSVTTLWLLCAKQASRASRKLVGGSKSEPGSPLTQRSKKLFATISNKAIKLRRKKAAVGGGEEFEGKGGDGGEEFGNGGLWQREILMGDKCQPLDFSGVIYYDKDGKRLSELPVRSPRASPLPRYAYTTARSDW